MSSFYGKGEIFLNSKRGRPIGNLSMTCKFIMRLSKIDRIRLSVLSDKLGKTKSEILRIALENYYNLIIKS